MDELEKLGLRKNTLIIFSGDNGTAAGYPSPVHGRMLNGWKGSMLEGGSRVPFIASWPGVTPAGKVLDDIVSFADPYMPRSPNWPAQSSPTSEDRRPELRPAASRRAGHAAQMGVCAAWREMVRSRAGLQAESGRASCST